MIMILNIHDYDDGMITVYNLFSYEIVWMFIYSNARVLFYSYFTTYFYEYELFMCNVSEKAYEDVSMIFSRRL